MRRSRALRDVEVACDLEVAASGQRVAAWPLPSRVEACELDGEPGLLAHFQVSPALQVASDTHARAAFDRLRRLDDAPPVRVRDFVKAFGPLFDPEDWSRIGYASLPYRPVNGVEAVSWYTEMGALLAATARLTSNIRHRRAVYAADLRTIADTLSPHSLLVDYTVSRAIAICETVLGGVGLAKERIPFSEGLRRIPEGVVNWWLGAKRVRPLLRWQSGNQPTVVWTGELWGAVGAQLLADVRRGGKVAECDGCGREVVHERLPKSGQRVWCASRKCRRLANREAQQRSRSRSAHAR